VTISFGLYDPGTWRDVFSDGDGGSGTGGELLFPPVTLELGYLDDPQNPSTEGVLRNPGGLPGECAPATDYRSAVQTPLSFSIRATASGQRSFSSRARAGDGLISQCVASGSDKSNTKAFVSAIVRAGLLCCEFNPPRRSTWSSPPASAPAVIASASASMHPAGCRLTALRLTRRATHSKVWGKRSRAARPLVSDCPDWLVAAAFLDSAPALAMKQSRLELDRIVDGLTRIASSAVGVRVS
jgi:hypothetical protein